jgi:hypothetical protein
MEQGVEFDLKVAPMSVDDRISVFGINIDMGFEKINKVFLSFL